jgi:predicted lipoprotein with Yx(FWY)xxD motif
MKAIRNATGLAVLALGLAAAISACSSSTSSTTSSTPTATATAAASASASSANTVKTTTINGTQVLTNAQGYTLYWFAPDTPTTSKCTGSCATYWPPVKGPVTAGSGVTGKLSTITRSNGEQQATYDGHPLYTYVGDTAPGQAKGNGLTLSGGKWYEMTVSGAAPSASASATSSSGGYGY